VRGVQEFRSSGVQEFRSSGVQEFRSSGVQVEQITKLQEKSGSADLYAIRPWGVDGELLNSCNS
jgi:hypothetical protein